MKKITDLIEIENNLVQESEKITHSYHQKTQAYIANIKEQIATLQSEIVNKSSIVQKRLSEKMMKSAPQSDISSNNIDTQKIQEIILSQL